MENSMKPWGRSIVSHRHYKVIVVASVHMVLVLCGMYLTVKDMINEEYPVNMSEVTYILIYYIVHFMLIALLILGVKHALPLLYVPWILVFLAVFTAATYFWIESIFKGISYIVPSITNITVLGFGWLGWWSVATEFFLVLQTTKTSYAIIRHQSYECDQ